MASGQLVISQTPRRIVLVELTSFPIYTFFIRLEITELAIASSSQLQLVIPSGQLVIKQTSSLIAIVEQTNFSFYTFLIRLEIAEIVIAIYCWLQLVIACGQLVISQTHSFIVHVEQTNSAFYIIYIRLDMEKQLYSLQKKLWETSSSLAEKLVRLLELRRPTLLFTPF